MAPTALRTSFAPEAALTPFFSGGAARLSPDGRTLAAACGDDAQLVDAAGGAVVATLPGDSEPLTALAFSPDGAAVYTASRSLQCRRWELGGAAPSCSRTWKAHTLPVNDINVDPSGALLATCSADRTARVWDAARGYCTHALKGHESPVLCVLFHPHARRLLLFTASEDTTVRCWDLAARGACAAVLRGHFSAVSALAVAAPSASAPGHLLSAGRDKVVTVWRLTDYAKAATVPVYEALEGVAVLPPGAPLPGAPPAAAAAGAGELAGVRFATAGERGTLRCWAAAGATCVYEAPRDPSAAARESGFTGVALLPAGAGIAVTTSDCRVLFYAPGDAASPAPAPDAGAKKAGKKGDKAAAPAPAAKAPALTLTRQLLGDLDEVIDARFLPPPPPSADAVVDADLPPPMPASLVVATNSAVLSVLDAVTLACTASLAGHADTVLCIDAASAGAAAGARAPRCSQLVASGGKDRSLRLWDAAAGRCLAAAEGHAQAVTAVAFGARSAALIITGGADKLLKLWDASAAIANAHAPEAAAAADGVPAAPPKLLRVTAAVAAHEKEVNAVAVSPTDGMAASGGADRLVKLWALPALTPLRTLRGHKRGVWSVAFSPVDAVIASASGDRTLRLWSVGDGACVRTLEGHAAGVLKALWLSAGTQLASAGADGCVRVWAVAAGEAAETLEAHEGKAWALAAAGDGARLLSGGADGALRLWRDATAEVAAAEAGAAEAAAADEQALANAARRGDFPAALALGLRLGRPGALHRLLTDKLSGGGAAAEAELAAAVAALPEESHGALLAHCAEWNANSRTCAVAQAALAALLRAAPAARLARAPNAAALADALHAYTQRHFARLDRLVRATYLLDFTLQQQGAILDDDDDSDGDNADGDAGADGFGSRLRDARAAAQAKAKPAAAALANGHAGSAAKSAAKAAAAQASRDALRGDDDDFGDVALPGWGGGGNASDSDAEEEEEAPQREASPPAAPAARKRARGAATAAAEEEEEPPARPKGARLTAVEGARLTARGRATRRAATAVAEEEPAPARARASRVKAAAAEPAPSGRAAKTAGRRKA